MTEAAFVILLTFMAGTASPRAHQTLYCRDQACVDRVLTAAPSSPLLARLRLFRGSPGDLGNGASVQGAILDEWFQ